MQIVCLDLEGVLVPEIWIAFAQQTGIQALKATTRDVPDYDELMLQRLALLDQHGLKMPDIQAVIARLTPLDGAREFLDRLRADYQVVILSDTYYEFAMPLMQQLGYPTLFCHKLEIERDGRVSGYCLRQRDPKRQSVLAFKSLYYKIIAAGDSYNDTSMLSEAHAGILFCPPDSVIAEFPQFPVTRNYTGLRTAIDEAGSMLND